MEREPHPPDQQEPQIPAEGTKAPGEGAHEQDAFYIHDDQVPPLSLDDASLDAFGDLHQQSMPFVSPFQLSGSQPPLGGSHHGSGRTVVQPAAPSPGRARRFLWKWGLGLGSLFLAVCAMVLLFVVSVVPSAGALPPPGTHGVVARATAPLGPGGQLAPTGTAGPTGAGTQGVVDWVPQPLPAGWNAAGLSQGDALFAARTALSFTDREMSLDYRSVGTRAAHGGTLTAATFVLTAGGKQRFAHNDVRVANNALFDRLQQQRLIQSVVNARPRLLRFQQQAGQQFAWVDVAFELWQSHVDPATGQRMEGKDLDAGTNAAKLHHMIVLLVRVPFAQQGAAPAMGGTGWLVSDYALDMPVDTLVLPTPV